MIAITNTEPDWEAGSELAREALLAILNSCLLYIPIPRREDKILKGRLFSALRDATDLPHATAAHTVGCTAIVAYDDHLGYLHSEVSAIAEIIHHCLGLMVEVDGDLTYAVALDQLDGML